MKDEGIAEGRVRLILHGAPLGMCVEELRERPRLALARVAAIVEPVVEQEDGSVLQHRRKRREDLGLCPAQIQPDLRAPARTAHAEISRAESAGRMWMRASALLPWFCVATGVGSALGPGLTCYPA